MRRFITGAVLALTISACGVSTQQEVQMGADYATQINQQLPIVRDAEINRYINVLGDSIARLTSRGQELDFQFFVVNFRVDYRRTSACGHDAPVTCSFRFSPAPAPA